MQHLLDVHGIEGYKENWVEHEFPLAIYEDLRKAG